MQALFRATIPFRTLASIVQCAAIVRSIPVSFVRGIKTHSGAKKRFHVTSSGKILRAGAGKQHNTGKHSRNILRMRGSTMEINGKGHEMHIRKKLLGLPSLRRR
mmetsp:Transcript_46582/g.93991  ORF Transcript_46582/g.93991 Transcript_46582/m.93991 type:complete len:104 (-) Transcript_46582:382-693(-)